MGFTILEQRFEKPVTTIENKTPLQRLIAKVTHLSRHRLEKKYKMLLLVLAAALLTTPSSMGQVGKERCLHSCECAGGKDQVTVQCHGLPKGAWPSIFPRNSSTLNLSHNPLLRVGPDDLQDKGLDFMVTLSLSNCHLEAIDPEAFRGFAHLKFLDLSHNKITGLTGSHFKDLVELEAIRLTGSDHEECLKVRRELSGVKVQCGRRPTTTTPSPEAATTSPTSPTLPTMISTTTYIESSSPSPTTSTDLPAVLSVKGGDDMVAAIVIGCLAAAAIVLAIVAVAKFKLTGKWSTGADSV